MKVSESVAGRGRTQARPGPGRPSLPAAPASALTLPPSGVTRCLFPCCLIQWGVLFLTPSSPLTRGGYLLMFTSTELPRSSRRHVGLTDEGLSSPPLLQPSTSSEAGPGTLSGDLVWFTAIPLTFSLCC